VVVRPFFEMDFQTVFFQKRGKISLKKERTGRKEEQKSFAKRTIGLSAIASFEWFALNSKMWWFVWVDVWI